MLLSPLLPQLLALSVVASSASAGQLVVTAVEPGLNATNVPNDTDIVIHFDRALALAALPPVTDHITVFGKNTGPSSGTWTLENGNSSARFDPAASFVAGEVVLVSLTSALTAVDASTLRSEGYAFSFRTRAAVAGRNFTELDRFSAQDASGAQTRVYGGQATDLDDDGRIDLAIVNEVTSDVRVFKGLASPSGHFGPLLMPPAGVGSTPSPNEPADFNGDGLIDIVTANIVGDSVTVLFGNGDGTFSGRTDHAVGATPHGMTVLDVNGDGAVDIVTANNSTSDLTLLVGDGSGGFAPGSSLEGGGFGEFAVAAGDMNADGIFDLVVGAQSSQRVIVQLGNGDGTFTQAGVQNGVGAVWMIVLGDLDGDGNLDVSTANGGSGTASILMGDGAGGLSAPQNYSTPSFDTATDLGDLDGDGDLDWMISSFGGHQWFLFENDGTGSFSLDQTFAATANPGCALLVDIDADWDLDIVLLDEISDEIILMENDMVGSVFCLGDGSLASACPCGNESDLGAGQGCLNLSGAGASILTSGTASIAADDLELTAVGVPTNQFGLFFSGTSPVEFPFGDGLRCIGGSIKRFPIRFSGSEGSYSQANVASIAGVLAGETLHFQGWFRDPVGPCGNTFNATTAVSVTFAP
jgi:hypothetical protein